MPDYSKSIIYTIRSRDNVYVGSTIDFRSRKKEHKGCIYNENGKKKKYNRKIYKTIRGNNHEWDMQPYSQYPCNSKIQLRIEEERVRQLLKADLNMCACSSGCSRNEYVKQYTEQHKDNRKQYYEENKNEISEQKKQYYEEHKDEINEKRRQKVTCECGCIVTRYALAQHRRSKKHIDLMEKLNQ